MKILFLPLFLINCYLYSQTSEKALFRIYIGTHSEIPFYIEPNIKSNSLGNLNQEAFFEVFQELKSKENQTYWLKIKNDSKFVYVNYSYKDEYDYNKSYIDLFKPLQKHELATIIKPEALLREKPDGIKKIGKKLDLNTNLKIIARGTAPVFLDNDLWYEVELDDKTRGFLRGNEFKKVSAPSKEDLGDKLLRYSMYGDNELAQIESLLKQGTDVNYRESYTGVTAAMTAAHYCNFETLNLLIKFGADMKIKDNNGRNVLMVTPQGRWQNCSEFVRIAIKNGADVKNVDSNGDNILSYHLYLTDLDTFEFLIQSGVDLNRKNKQGKTIIDLANIPQIQNKAELLKSYLKK